MLIDFMQREIVVPGDVISEKPEHIENTYIYSNKTYSKVLGIYDAASRSLVPLEGSWKPRREDSVVGIVTEVRNKVYLVDLSYFGKSFIVVGKYDEYAFKEGDIFYGEVKDIESRKNVVIKDAKKLDGGMIIHVKPKKVLRIIGKKSTMVRQISDITGTEIIIGLNGIIWLNGGRMDLAIKTIFKIEQEAHNRGLTDAIKSYLEEEIRKEVI